MPVLDGFEATKMIKSSPENSNTVIIALTASAFEEDRENILANGCDDFLRKPFRQEEIFTMLSKHLGVRFIYEEQTRGEVPLSPEDAGAQLLILAREASIYNRLSSEWLSELKQATIKADQSTMLDLINKIKQDEPALASALNDLTENFDYQEILTFLTEVEQ